MSKKINKDSMKYKIIAFVIFVIFLICITIAAFPVYKLLKTQEGRVQLQNFIVSYKTLGILVFLIIQTLQVVVAIIPPIQIVGGMMFGGVVGSILSLAGVFLGTVAVFYLVRWLGRPLVEALVDKKQIRKFKFLEDGERLEHILFILFLIPGTPKDTLAYLVPLTKIDARKFFCYVMPARIPAIVISCFLGSSISGGHKVTAIVLMCLFIVCAILGLIFRDRVVNFLKNRKEKIVDRVQKNKAIKIEEAVSIDTINNTTNKTDITD
ncbi:MAG: TVP38/TMEM64 family protein, partial [Clostridiales bacterium]|nr:TVP38/TMEM64 family protein [Clostridiales bacterium]